MPITKEEAARWDMKTLWQRVEPVPEKHSEESTVYSDRLLQWDWDKHNKLCREIFGDEGQYWNNREPKKIEEFLGKYNDNTELSLTTIFQGTNAGNGYPYWLFEFKCEPSLG